jgi:hypothetical protein
MEIKMAKKEKKTLIETHGIAGLYGLTDPALANIISGVSAQPQHRMTGQMISMARGMKDGREVFALFGVVGVPKGVLLDMHKYPLVGMPREQHTDIIFSHSEAIDRTELCGLGIAGIMTNNGEWRI